MEQELIRKINNRGVKAEYREIEFSEEAELKFCNKAYQLLRDFAQQPMKNRVNKLAEYFVENSEKHFD